MEAAVINKNGYYGLHKNGKPGFSFANVGLTASNAMKVSETFILPIWLNITYFVV
jgi:hypothetical protein